MNTTVANDLSQDGHSWSQANPLLIDKYGKIIIPLQRLNNVDKLNVFVYSNDDGATWIDNPTVTDERFIERGAAAYDTANDAIHMLWIGQSADQGVFYRRYIPARDGEHNLTGIARADGVSLVLDHQTNDPMQFQHPILLHLDDQAYGQYGALLAIWSARNRGATAGNEIRASMCVMQSDPNACGDAKAWTAPVVADTSTIGISPVVAYSALVANKTVDIAFPSAIRKRAGTHRGDVYLFFHDGDGIGKGAWAFRRLRWNDGAANWSDGLTEITTISPQQRAGTDTGYSLKQQLGTRPVEDAAHDLLYFGFATWKNDTDGDTWSFVALDAANDDKLSAIVDAYVAGGPHSYAPTGDITFDEASGQLVVAYIKTGTQAIFVRRYKGIRPDGDEIAVFDKAPVDIPILASPPRYGEPGRLLILFRDTIHSPQPPYHGWFGSLTWQ